MARTPSGSGMMGDIADIIYVKSEAFDLALDREDRRRAAEFNNRMRDQGRPYILMGPGR